MKVKAMLRTLEAVIGILIIATVFVNLFQKTGPLPDFETVNWKLIGFNALRTLDSNLGLRQEVLTGNTSAIEGRLSQFMPATANYTVKICDVSCASPGISTSGIGIVSVSYLVAGYRDSFAPRQVVLYLWPKSS